MTRGRPDRFIGLISGTSMDAIDGVLVDFGDRTLSLLACERSVFPAEIRQALDAACTTGNCDLPTLMRASVRFALRCAEIVQQLLQRAQISGSSVRAVGSHGQTLWHDPDGDYPFSLQVGDPATIAARTGICTVADFRSLDVALGGQGAPLVTPFHSWLFNKAGAPRAIVNIGGIANLTILPADDTPPTGYDTGPGNTLMDQWIRRARGEEYDRNGVLAASGRINEDLLAKLLDHPFYRRAPPKSTGRETFHLPWLDRQIATLAPIDNADVMSTLAELTARTVATEITRGPIRPKEVFVCGGGAENGHLMKRLRAGLPEARIETTEVVGLPPNWVEAVAFAWLARERIAGRPGNNPSVTGASRFARLGAIYDP